MKHLLISSSGEIDKKAFSLMGASTKRDDTSKIGHFGSGLKYAIAYLLGNNINFKVFSGEKEIKFSLRKETLRDNTFQTIVIDGIPTSLTVEMGPDWKLWMAIREIYCNALDEEWSCKDVVEDGAVGREGYTRFFIEVNTHVQEILDSWDTMFSIDRESIYEDDNVKVYRPISDNVNVYRKGIRCYEEPLKSIYDYDIKNLEINESRIVKHDWYIPRAILSMYSMCDNVGLVRDYLKASCKSDIIERQGIVSLNVHEFNDSWLEAIDDRILVPHDQSGFYKDIRNPLVLPNWLCDSLKFYFKDKVQLPKGVNGKVSWKELEVTALEEQILKSADEFFSECNIEQPYPITVVEFSAANILGSADIDNKSIYISRRCLDMGKFEVINTIIEELVHIKYQCEDCTREMQTGLISFFLSYVQKQNCYVL